ncbi:MAG: hypothetical protein ABFE07_25580 [Armatimonadia bacterium]
MTSAPLVTLYDGRQVPSDHVDWMHECEARMVLAMPMVERVEFLNKVAKIRKHDGLMALKRRCHEIEPYFVLDLPDKAARNAYAARVAERFGVEARDALQAKVRAIWEARKAAIASASQDAAQLSNETGLAGSQ